MTTSTTTTRKTVTTARGYKFTFGAGTTAPTTTHKTVTTGYGLKITFPVYVPTTK